MAYENYTGSLKMGAGLIPKQDFPLVRACDVVMGDDTRLDEYLENFSGGGGNSTTVWKINDTPDLTSLSLSTEYPLTFVSNGVAYTGIGIRSVGSSSWGINSLCFFVGNNTNNTVFTNNPDGKYGISHGWADDAYKTIAITEPITDKTISNWLKANATVIGVYVSPTTWEINDTPVLTTFPPAYDPVKISFTSNGEDFAKMYAMNGKSLVYVKTNGTPVSAYSSDNGWNTQYKVITITEPIEDVRLYKWLKKFATLISGEAKPPYQLAYDERLYTEDQSIVGAINELHTRGSTGGGGSDDSLDMPIIKFVNAQFNELSQEGYLPSGNVSEEFPLRLSVEVIGGKLQVGDELQVCVRRTYHTVEYDADGNKYKRRKQKLRRFCWRPITEQNINERFLAVTIYGDLGKNESSCLYHNDRKQDNPRLSPLYLRIRRPVGDLQQNESGMTVDAKFSNVVTVWKSYALDGKLSIK